MKLSQICQEDKRLRGGICETVMFHGTSNPKQILKTGLKYGLGEYHRNQNHLGSLQQALAYGDFVNDAGVYGKYIVEVEVDDEDEDALLDEDAVIMMANPDDPSWVRKIKNLPPELELSFHKRAMQEGGWEPGYDGLSLIDLIQKYKLKLRTNLGTFGDTRGNISIAKDIGFEGPTKIIAMYHLKKLKNAQFAGRQELSKKNDSENPLDDIQSNKFGNDENEFEGEPQYYVAEIIYGAGSLSIDDIVIGSDEKWFSHYRYEDAGIQRPNSNI